MIAFKYSCTTLKLLYNQERKSNRLRDYTTMAGPLGVSHLLLFSRSTIGNINLRLALTPRGPTLHFRVEGYSLCKDVRNSMRHPKGGMKSFLTSPLLVMNNMVSPKSADNLTAPITKQLESLTTAVFQSLFPPISPQDTPLPSIRRVLVLDRELSATSLSSPSSESATYHINLRHYAITTKKTGLSRGIRQLDAAHKPTKDRATRKYMLNLGNLDDVADYLLDPNAVGVGHTSGSENEVETDAEVEVLETKARKVDSHHHSESFVNRDDKEFGRGPHSIERRVVKLVELGPRLSLRMTKVEDGVCAGRTMWHEYVSKSKEEVNEMEEIWEGRRQNKEKIKKAQRENVKRKKSLEKAIPNEIVQDSGLIDSDEWDGDESEVTSFGT